MMMQQQRGFNLMELMIAVAIIGIIVAVAVPSYQGHMQSTRRVSVTACLTELGQLMERSYITAMAYAQTLPATSCQNELTDFYTLTLEDKSATTFTLKATPKGIQEKDSLCGVLTLNQAGAKTAKGSSDLALIRQCW
jgi:type IV pilus assembly protein PilE